MVYLAGPMHGYSQRNFPKFEAATRWLRRNGYLVLSPHEINEHLGDSTREINMRRDIHALMMCEGIMRLYGWEKSAGATCENTIAVQLGMRIFDLEQLHDETFIAKEPKS